MADVEPGAAFLSLSGILLESISTKVLGSCADLGTTAKVLSFTYARNNGAGEKSMKRISQLVLRLRGDNRGQDLIEYALMAGFVAVAAGAIMPGVSDNISSIFSKVAS